MQKLPATLFAVGICSLAAVLVFGWLVLPQTIHTGIENEMRLTNGSVLFDEWTNPDQETYLKIRIFNVTNPNEIELGADPIVKELGPYVYKQVRVKRILEENNDNDTLHYTESMTYFFDENLSNGKENDTITVINIAFVAVAQEIMNYTGPLRWFATMYLSKFKPAVFVNRTVEEFLFSGTYDPMIDEIEKLTSQKILQNSTFGMFYGQNGTELDNFEIYSGIKDSSKLGEIISLNGKPELDYWAGGSACNVINGTDGNLYPPFITKETKLYMHRPELCRSIYLTYENDVTVRGVPGYRFVAPPTVFESPRENPENRCFCSEENMDECPKKGVFRASTCKNTAPIILSSPQFLYGDPEYSKKFGLNPTKELHEARVDLEPRTGIPLALHKRFQVNLDVRRLPKNYKFKNIQDMVFPVVWMDESYIISAESVAKMNLITSLGVIDAVKWCALSASVILILASLAIFWMRIRRKSVFV